MRASHKPFNAPVMRHRHWDNGWELIDAEPDIIVEKEDKARPKNQSRANVKPVKRSAQEDGVADEKKNPVFREGSKRDIAYKALDREQGCTAEEGMVLLKWGKNVVISQFYECANLSGRKIERVKEDDEVIYRLV